MILWNILTACSRFSRIGCLSRKHWAAKKNFGIGRKTANRNGCSSFLNKTLVNIGPKKSRQKLRRAWTFCTAKSSSQHFRTRGVRPRNHSLRVSRYAAVRFDNFEKRVGVVSTRPIGAETAILIAVVRRDDLNVNRVWLTAPLQDRQRLMMLNGLVGAVGVSGHAPSPDDSPATGQPRKYRIVFSACRGRPIDVPRCVASDGSDSAISLPPVFR